MDPLARSSEVEDDPNPSELLFCKRCGDIDGIEQVPRSLSLLLDLEKEDLICAPCRQQSFEYISNILSHLKEDINNSSMGTGTVIPDYITKGLLQLLVPSIRTIISQNDDIRKSSDDFSKLRHEVIFVKEQITAISRAVDEVSSKYDKVCTLVDDINKIPTYQTRSVSPLDISPYQSDTENVTASISRRVEHKTIQVGVQVESKETQVNFIDKKEINTGIVGEKYKANEKSKEKSKDKRKEKEKDNAKEKENDRAKEKDKEKVKPRANEKGKVLGKGKNLEKEKDKEKVLVLNHSGKNHSKKKRDNHPAKGKKTEKKTSENVAIDLTKSDESGSEYIPSPHSSDQEMNNKPVEVKEPKKENKQLKNASKYISVSKKQIAKVIYNNLYLISILKSPFTMPLPTLKQNCFVKTEQDEKTTWVSGSIKSITLGEQNKYCVEISSSKTTIDATSKDIANWLNDAKQCVFNMGNRVIALKDGVGFMSGVIAEMPDIANKYRYLIFCSNGEAIYEEFTKMRMIFEQTIPPHEYFQPSYQKFIVQYFKQMPKRKILDIKVSDHLKVKHNGRWIQARVVEVENSIIKISYLNDQTKWIYKGSPDVYDILNDFLTTKNTDSESPKKSQEQRIKRSTCALLVPGMNSSDSSDEDAVKIVEVDDRVKRKEIEEEEEEDSTDAPIAISSEHKVDKRRKRKTRVRHKNVTEIIPKYVLQPKPYKPHPCNKNCVKKSTTSFAQISNHLAVPSSLGFGRELNNKVVFYKAPCGVILSNCNEILDYISKTKIKLTIDMFDFSPDLNIYDEFITKRIHVLEDDISDGKEFRAIPCVNEVDHACPPYIPYITNRVEIDTSFLNLDPGFLVCCDCVDNCNDKTRCACRQLTLSTAKEYDANANDIGYENKRLYSNVITGIYECNKRCKCSNNCLNRVVQLPFVVKLQLFKTEKTGWGTRTIHDIPKGTFVCLYAGQIIPDIKANEIGVEKGDDYFAELDFIDTMEDLKDLSDDDDNGAVSIRDLYKCKDKAFILDGQAVGNIGKYINHCCEPNLFVQNVFVDTPDLRFPWVAFFAAKTIFAGTELTWDYGYQIDAIPNRVIYCYCGAKKCRKRLM